MKKHTFFDRGTTLFFLGAIIVLHVVVVYACLMFFQNYVGMERWLLVAFFAGIILILDLVLVLGGAYRNLLSRHSFDKTGINCFNLQWGKYRMPWETIRTYGVFYYSFSYANTIQLFFSQKKDEKLCQDIKESCARRKDRIVVNLLPEMWDELQNVLPTDMLKNIEDAVEHRRGGFFRR